MASTPLPYLLTEDEAAELLAMLPSKLRYRRRRRVSGDAEAGPRFLRIGRRIRYLSADLKRWARSHKQRVSPYEPDHRAAGQWGVVLPRRKVLTDADVCAVLRISARDARDLRLSAMSGNADAFPRFSREARSVVVNRDDLVEWLEGLAALDENLGEAIERRAS